MADVIIVLSTVPDQECGERIARQLVEERLVACAQLASSPLTSFYRWKGALAAEEEWGLSLKSTAELWPALRELLVELHPYETPQILRLDVEASEAYRRWIEGLGSEEPLDP